MGALEPMIAARAGSSSALDERRRRSAPVEPPGSASGERARFLGRSSLRTAATLVVVALVVHVPVRVFLVEQAVVPPSSMDPTLTAGDRVLVDKLAYRVGGIERGDVVAMDGAGTLGPPTSGPESEGPLRSALRRVAGWFGVAPAGERVVVRRVVGLPGDRVRCCDPAGRLVVNGVGVAERYIHPGDVPSRMPFDVDVPEGKLWVMGDHRATSTDSRDLLGSASGPFVPTDDVIGKVAAVVWPLGHAGTLPTATGLADAPSPSGGASRISAPAGPLPYAVSVFVTVAVTAAVVVLSLGRVQLVAGIRRGRRGVTVGRG